MKRKQQPSTAARAPVLPLPKFVISRRPNGRMAIRELQPGDNGQAIVERLRCNPGFTIVWLAAAFQGATAAACEASAP